MSAKSDHDKSRMLLASHRLVTPVIIYVYKYSQLAITVCQTLFTVSLLCNPVVFKLYSVNYFSNVLSFSHFKHLY